MTDEPDNPRFLRAMLDDLPALNRLALGYAPVSSRPLWLAFFALDRRFAQIVSAGREPMLAQMRLAWWREVLQKPAEERPTGDPLLTALAGWDEERAALAALADGWEAMIGEAPLDVAAFAALAGARAGMAVALVRLAGGGGRTQVAETVGYRWGLTDLATHLSDPVERGRVQSLLHSASPCGTTPRLLRPLAILEAMAARAVSRKQVTGGVRDLAVAMRIGLIGR